MIVEENPTRGSPATIFFWFVVGLSRRSLGNKKQRVVLCCVVLLLFVSADAYAWRSVCLLTQHTVALGVTT